METVVDDHGSVGVGQQVQRQQRYRKMETVAGETVTEEMQDDEYFRFLIIIMAHTHRGKDYRGRYTVMIRTKLLGRRKQQNIHGEITSYNNNPLEYVSHGVGVDNETFAPGGTGNVGSHRQRQRSETFSYTVERFWGGGSCGGR